MRDNSVEVAPAGGPAEFRRVNQRVDQGLDTTLDFFRSPRRALADVVEDARQFPGGSLREAKLHKPCFAQIA
jgi:hypothetical protein